MTNFKFYHKLGKKLQFVLFTLTATALRALRRLRRETGIMRCGKLVIVNV